MTNFWDSSVWGFICTIAVLLISLLVANLLKKSFRFLRASLIPTSVLAGLILLIIVILYKATTGNELFNTAFFNYNGQAQLEMITYHCLALGFIASTLGSKSSKFTKERYRDILNTGITTVSTYVLQGIIGLAITLTIGLIVKDFFTPAGTLLPFGYGQGTGQAMNYGALYENTYGFVGGKSFGLSIAALGFLSASIGGVIHLNIMRKRGKYIYTDEEIYRAINNEEVHSEDQIPMNGSIDKMSVQVAIILIAYIATYFVMLLFKRFVPGLASIMFGFNFLIGVMMATALKSILSLFEKKGIVKKKYINIFLQNRLCGLFFDLMIVAGIAAIRIDLLKGTWGALLIMGFVGAVLTYLYLRFVAKKLFRDYIEEEFIVMYGMLTGTASTGMMLLREVDPDYKSYASDNLVYQNFPAIVLGFPMMIIATLSPKNPELTLVSCVVYFVLLNIFLFRTQIFKKKNK